MIEKILVNYLDNGVQKETTLEIEEFEENVKVKCVVNQMVVEKQADNYFEALKEIRNVLENKEIKLLCKGCCENVYPSAMILSMGYGRKAYTLKQGEPAKMDSLVDIFDICAPDEYATVKQQEDFFKCWINS